MKKAPRVNVPKSVSDAILEEFNHRCAVCGESKPQLHHIDENRSNHAPLNLIPLCPNCHLIDAHRPTRPIDAGILGLFRKFRDPSLLTPEFFPLYQRYIRIVDPKWDMHQLDYVVKDFIRFVRALQMGDYYAKSLEDYTTPESVSSGQFQSVGEYDQVGHAAALKTAQMTAIMQYYPQITNMVIELLRYQGWSFKAPRKPSV